VKAEEELNYFDELEDEGSDSDIEWEEYQAFLHSHRHATKAHLVEDVHPEPIHEESHYEGHQGHSVDRHQDEDYSSYLELKKQKRDRKLRRHHQKQASKDEKHWQKFGSDGRYWTHVD